MRISKPLKPAYEKITRRLIKMPTAHILLNTEIKAENHVLKALKKLEELRKRIISGASTIYRQRTNR